jgi:hypothetical protein
MNNNQYGIFLCWVPFMLSVVFKLLNVTMLSVIMLNITVPIYSIEQYLGVRKKATLVAQNNSLF